MEDTSQPPSTQGHTLVHIHSYTCVQTYSTYMDTNMLRTNDLRQGMGSEGAIGKFAGQGLESPVDF